MSLLAKCHYSRCRYTQRILCGSLMEKRSGQEIDVVTSGMSLQAICRYKQYVVISNNVVMERITVLLM